MTSWAGPSQTNSIIISNDVSKIRIVHQMISSHKMIYNIFGSGIYHKPHSIFKSKYQEFHNKKLAFLAEMKLGWLDISWGCNGTRRLKKFFNILYPLHNSSVFLPITHSTKQLGILMIISGGRGAMYFSICFSCLGVLCLADSNNSGMENFYYYYRMTNQ